MNNKINYIHDRALRLVYSDDVSSFDELLKKRPIILCSSQEPSKSGYWNLQVFSRFFPNIMKNVSYLNTNIPHNLVNFIVEIQK